MNSAAIILDNCIWINAHTITNCAEYGIEYFGVHDALMPAFSKEQMDVIYSVERPEWYEFKKKNFVQKHFPAVYFQYQVATSKLKKGGE